jgi:ParB family chromosome partitioning protein
MSPSRGLGRGLGALLPSSPQPGESTPNAVYREIPVESITANPRQPREHFDEQALAELAASIREVGLLQPVVVREAAGGYQLVVGERRWRAGQLAGLTAIPAIVRGTGDEEMLREALLENLQREQLNPLEEAAAYRQMLSDFGTTHEELAQRLGKSRSQVSNTLRLLGLPPAVQRRVAAGVLSAGHARALLGLDDPAAQERLAERIVAEGLSVRAVEELVAVGERPRPERAAPERATVPAEAQALADRLADRLETKVRLQPGRRRGRLIVEYGSLDDLYRISRAIFGDEGAGP